MQLYIMRQSSQMEGAGNLVQSSPEPTMHLAVVACGERLEETLTMIKSAVLFSIKRLYLHVFAEDQLHASFMEALILKDIDSIVYVDSDILFLQPVDGLWDFLSRFNPSQLAAMSPEHEEPRIAWYSRFARHPFYGRTGINSGVMLMNMTRMRSTFFKSFCWSFHASGTIAQITASMAVTVPRLKRMASTSCMETEEFTTTTNSQLSEAFMMQ
ncbi:hypothetical protein GOODEAATRI_016013 [Goodea atripinnis]|uniref:Glucoside xylosyltransferase 1 n=1 Tax=Goodea atripinnis TaxID=208336 RepID=A0ABV0PEG5_9TELE